MRVLYVFIPQPPENHHDINNEVSKKVPDKGVPVNQENKKKSKIMQEIKPGFIQYRVYQ